MKTKLLPLLSLLLAVTGTVRAATLEVDAAQSRIQVAARATGHGFTGTLDRFTVKIAGDSTTLAPASCSLNWNFQDLKTANAERDADMIKWLGGGAPQGSFKFGKSWTDHQGVTHAQGTMTIHGVSKTVSFPYTVKKSANVVTIAGKATLDYQDFNLPLVRAMLVMTVDPKLVVSFHIVGKIK